MQVGVTLAGFFASAYGGSTLSEPLGEVLAGWGVPAGIAGTVAFIAVTAFISYLSLVLGELVPKRLALQRGEGVALFVAPMLDRVATLTRPDRLAAVGVDQRRRADARHGPAGRGRRGHGGGAARHGEHAR